mgnify:CR=1 FL=1
MYDKYCCSIRKSCNFLKDQKASQVDFLKWQQSTAFLIWDFLVVSHQLFTKNKNRFNDYDYYDKHNNTNAEITVGGLTCIGYASNIFGIIQGLSDIPIT